MNHFHVLGQAFHRAQFAVIFQHHAFRRHHFHDGVDDVLLHGFHQWAGNLRHHHVTKAVDDQTWQTVAVAIHPTVTTTRVPQLTAAERNFQTVHNQRAVQLLTAVTADQTGADQLLRAYHSTAQCLAIGGFDHHLRAWLHAFQRRGGNIHFVAVYPQVAGFQTALGLGLESQNREG